MKLQIKDSGACPTHPLVAVVPPDWKQFVEACAEGENCTVNISAIARRAKKLLGGAGSGLVQPVAVQDGIKQDGIEAAELQTLLIAQFECYRPTHPAGLMAWAKIALLDCSPHRTASAAQGDAETIRQAAFKEAIDACYKATASRVKVQNFGAAAHYIACVDAIRAIAAKRTGQ